MSAIAEKLPTRPEAREKIPAIFSALAALAFLFVFVIILALLWKMPWSGLWGYVSAPAAVKALQISAIVSFSAAGISAVLGMALAFVITKTRGALQTSLRVVFLLPLVLPPVAGGIALLFALGRRGILGQWLDRWLNISLPFTITGAIVAASFVALPFFVISAETALARTSPELEEAAKNLGAKKLGLFFRIILPQIRTGVLAGFVLSWARALGEFGATVTFAGNLSGRTQTLPLAMYEALESGRFSEALSISFLLLAISAFVLILLRRHWFSAFQNR